MLVEHGTVEPASFLAGHVKPQGVAISPYLEVEMALCLFGEKVLVIRTRPGNTGITDNRALRNKHPGF